MGAKTMEKTERIEDEKTFVVTWKQATGRAWIIKNDHLVVQ